MIRDDRNGGIVTYQPPDDAVGRGHDGCSPGHVVHEGQLAKEALVVVVAHQLAVLRVGVDIDVVFTAEREKQIDCLRCAWFNVV